MSREPNERSARPGIAGPGHVLGDEPPVEVYPLQRGGRAVPDRSREPAHRRRLRRHTDRVPARPAFTDELRERRRAAEHQRQQRARAEDDPGVRRPVREARGVRTRPVRPGQHA